MKLDPKLQAQLGEMFAAPAGEAEMTGILLMVDITKIQTATQPRQHFESGALRELENSIRELHGADQGVGGSGILQPLLVRVGESGNYIVTAGERRLRAAKAVGLQQVPIIISEDKDEIAWEHAIIENIVRDDLGPLEEAEAIGKLMQARGYSVREAAKKLGKDKGYLENRLFLLKAPDDVKDMVRKRADTIRHAREIAKVENPKSRKKLIEAATDGASFSAIQERIRSTPTAKKGAKSKVSAPADTPQERSSNETFDIDTLARAGSTLEAALDQLKKLTQALPANKRERKKLAATLEKQVSGLQELIAHLKS